MATEIDIVAEQERRRAEFWEAVKTSPNRVDTRVECEGELEKIGRGLESRGLKFSFDPKKEAAFSTRARAWTETIQGSGVVSYGMAVFFRNLSLPEELPVGLPPDKVNEFIAVLVTICQEALVVKDDRGGYLYDKEADLMVRQGNVTTNPESTPMRGVVNVLGIYDFAREKFGALVKEHGGTQEQVDRKVDALIDQIGLKSALVREATNTAVFVWDKVEELAKDKARLGGEAQPVPREKTPMKQMEEVAGLLEELRNKIVDKRTELDQISEAAADLARLIEEQTKEMVKVEELRQLAAVAKAAEEKADLGGILTVEGGFDSINAFEKLADNIETVMDVWQIQGETREIIVNAVRANHRLLIGDNAPEMLRIVKLAISTLMKTATEGKYGEIMEAIGTGLEGSKIVVREPEVSPDNAVMAARERLEGLQKRLGGV